MKTSRSYRPCPILPIGMVNLQTGKNKEFGTVWNCWDDAKDTYLLVKSLGADKYRAIITSDSLENVQKYYPVGHEMLLQHDQTGAKIGMGWEVVGHFSNTPEGLRAMSKACRRNSISFSTFK